MQNDRGSAADSDRIKTTVLLRGPETFYVLLIIANSFLNLHDT